MSQGGSILSFLLPMIPGALEGLREDTVNLDRLILRLGGNSCIFGSPGFSLCELPTRYRFMNL